MSLPATTKKYLDKKLAKYETVAHKTVYTAYDLAQTLKKELREIGKTLLIATDRAYVLVVVPAHMRLDLGRLKKALKVKKVSITPEKVMVKVFKVKAGAMTAFGGLHKLEVLADQSLLKTKDVILSAGNFTDSVRMKVADYLKMEQAKLAQFASSAGYKLQVKSKPAKKKSRKRRTLAARRSSRASARRRPVRTGRG